MQNAKLKKSDARTIRVLLNGQESVVHSRSVQNTHRFAKKLVKELHGGDVLALSGKLGAGKTTFVQGLAKALGVKKQITSPTFVLMNIYALLKSLNGITRLCHSDAYRLESARELEAIGAQEYISSPDTLTVIEWPERVKGLIPKNAIWISFEHGGKV
ncbi:tRNA (adenosine(37)-N6)-threonylcarbamoyltransferase complex ATPase subunit type 1 TsaE [Candidatus Uhrbacteria bacterium]|nr:tRNA (adenosine(37)-N6)-threonylcarbamoyltransferase complex ATPase subunit type 1 TsaE [Candidatus Uhrbacteria bacterium]